MRRLLTPPDGRAHGWNALYNGRVVCHAVTHAVGSVTPAGDGMEISGTASSYRAPVERMRPSMGRNRPVVAA